MQIHHTLFDYWKEKEYRIKLEKIEHLRRKYHQLESNARLLRNCRFLNQYQVHYLIVGGYAVGIHGVPRYTGDLDILVDTNENNIASLLLSIQRMNFHETPFSLDQLLKPNSFIQLGSKPQKIDFLNQIPMPEFNFEKLYSNRLIVDLDGVMLNFISNTDLLRNKNSCTRKKDKEDIPFLHLD